MSTQTAAPATAPTTEEANAAAKVPSRSEVLTAFAREAMGETEPEAPAAVAAGENADEALSQTRTDEVIAEAPAEAEENHLEDELRQELPEPIQDRINRRIGKEVAKTKTEREGREAAEARVSELETQLQSTVHSPQSTVQNGALGQIHDRKKLGGEKVKAEQALEQAEDLLTQLEDSPGEVEAALRAAKIELKNADGEDDYTDARMRKFLRQVRTNADNTLRRAIPKREEFLKVAEQHAISAVELMPELKDGKSERFKLFQQVIREHPEIQGREDWPLRAMAGVKALEWLKEQVDARTKANGKPAAAKRELPVTIPTPRAQPPRTAGVREPEKLDANAIADAVLSGDKSARLKLLTGLVPVK